MRRVRHLARSAAFIGLLHADGVSGRVPARAYARDLSERVERILCGYLPDGHRLTDHLTPAVVMVSGAVTGPTPGTREHRALAA